MFQENETQTAEFELLKRLGQTSMDFGDTETQDFDYQLLKRIQR